MVYSVRNAVPSWAEELRERLAGLAHGSGATDANIARRGAARGAVALASDLDAHWRASRADGPICALSAQRPLRETQDRMPTIESAIDRQSETFQAQRQQMLALIDNFRDLEGRVRDTSNAMESRFRERRQLLPRERVSLLLDRGSPWLELSTLAGLRLHDDDGEKNVLGGALITGIGIVSGIRCMVIASDSAIKGGTITPMGMRKSLRAEAIALENRLPVVRLVESGGANLMHVGEVFIEGGRGFANQARLSAAGIPQVTVMHGHSTAGGAYLPGMSDYVIMVRGRAKAFLAGPPLLKAATGEIAGDEELGGAEMHTRVSGVAEYLAEDDADGIRIARDVLARMPWNDKPGQGTGRGWKPPRYAAEEIAGLIDGFTGISVPAPVGELVYIESVAGSLGRVSGPVPEPPMTTSERPLGTARSTPFSTDFGPKRFVTFWRRMWGLTLITPP